MINPRLLDRGQCGVRRIAAGGCAGESFDCGNFLAFDRADRGYAAADRHAVNMDSAGAAGGNAAAELSAGHTEFVA